MTNYVEALLREQEGEEVHQTEYDWRKAWEETALLVSEEAGTNTEVGRDVLREKMDGMPAGMEELADSAEWTAKGLETEGSEGSGYKTGERADQTASLKNANLWESVDTERYAALPGEWMYQALKLSLRALPASRQESRVVTLQKPGEREKGGAWDAAGLDRLVRRDARRFDGGFQLL